ncbi:nuclear cap-binding protein subunit 2 [Ditylenchus destructor]|nr:nuclear cap-binding protein subunit 2 [Ditylenchus destructor]
MANQDEKAPQKYYCQEINKKCHALLGMNFAANAKRNEWYEGEVIRDHNFSTCKSRKKKDATAAATTSKPTTSKPTTAKPKRAPAAAAPPEMANDPEANQIPSITKNKALNSTQSPKNLGLVDTQKAQQLLNSTTLWVGKLLFTTTEEKISELFSRAGPVRRVIMGLDREKKTPCGFCFVEYEKRIDAENVMRDKESYVLDGQKLVIGWDVGFTEGRQWGRGRHGGQEMEPPITLFPSAEPTTIVKTEIDETEYNLRRMSLARKSAVFAMRDSSSPDEMAKRRNQFASNESQDEMVPDSFEEVDPTTLHSATPNAVILTKQEPEQEQTHSGENQVIQPKPRRRVAQLFEPQSEHNADSSSRSSRSHSTKSSDTLERGFRDCDQHMNWPAACKECTKEQKKCKYHEEMDRRRANISVDTSQTSDSSEGCHFCKECSNGMCCTHKNQAYYKEVLPPTPQFEISRADQVDTDTE